MNQSPCAIAIPNFQSLIRSQRVKGASFELFSSLIVARSEAVKQNGNVVITPVSSDWALGWEINSPRGVFKNHGALPKIVVTGAPTTLTYKRTGRLALSSADSVNFQLDVDPADTAYTRCITIELSGMPRTIKGVCP